MKKVVFSLILACVMTAGCTDNGLLLRSNGKDYITHDTNGVYKVGEPYQINNIWYRPEENYKYKEVGIASWYGPDFHKGITANGETYNMHEMSAAHRTLPLPSIVKVTNLDNGKSVIVRVNDRGPFVNNRVIDLSKAAAEKLDFIDKGTAKVRVEILADESKDLKKRILSNGGKVVGGAPIADVSDAEDTNQTALPEPIVLVPNDVAVDDEMSLNGAGAFDKSIADDAPLYSPKTGANPTFKKAVAEKGNYYIQAGAFSQKANALAVKNRLSSFGPILIQEINNGGRTIYRVRIGAFETGAMAAEVMEQIESSGYSDIRLVQEK